MKVFILTTISFFMISSNMILSQETNVNGTDSNNIKLGLKAGFGNTYVDTRIGTHISFNLSGEIPIVRELDFQLQTEYFETNKSEIYRTLNHQGSIYKALLPLLWKNFSIDLGIKYLLIKNLKAGFGISSEFIKIEEIKYLRENPFYIDQFENITMLNMDKIKINMIKPGIFICLDFSMNLINQIYLDLQPQFKMIYTGEKYSSTSLKTENTYTIYMGIIYSF